MTDEVGKGPPGMPLWVKVFVGIAIALVVVVVAVLIIGGGEHGPGRHLGGHVDAGARSQVAERPLSEFARTDRPLHADGATDLQPHWAT